MLTLWPGFGNLEWARTVTIRVCGGATPRTIAEVFSSYFAQSIHRSVCKRVLGLSIRWTAPLNESLCPVWIVADDGVFHSTSPFTQWQKVSGSQRATFISVGAPPSKDAFPAVCIVGYAASSWTQGVYKIEVRERTESRSTTTPRLGLETHGTIPSLVC